MVRHAGEGLWWLLNEVLDGFYSSLLLLYVGLNVGGGCGYGIQHALGKTTDAYTLLEMYILKMCTVSSWHGIEFNDRCCVQHNKPSKVVQVETVQIQRKQSCGLQPTPNFFTFHFSVP